MRKVLFSIALVIVGICLPVCSQNDTNAFRRTQLTPEKKAERKVESLNRILNLTDKQKSEIQTVYTEFLKSCMGASDNKPKRQLKCEEREKLNKQIEALLTNEQIALFREKCQQRPGGKGRRNMQ